MWIISKTLEVVWIQQQSKDKKTDQFEHRTWDAHFLIIRVLFASKCILPKLKIEST